MVLHLQHRQDQPPDQPRVPPHRQRDQRLLDSRDVVDAVRACPQLRQGEPVRRHQPRRRRPGARRRPDRRGAKDTIHPLQIAVRISLQGTGRGRSKQGGFYLPGCAVQLDAALQSISTLNRVDLASSLHTLFSDLVGAGAGNMVIASKNLGNVPVTSFRIGDRFDTIRSRRNELIETYLVETYP